MNQQTWWELHLRKARGETLSAVLLLLGFFAYWAIATEPPARVADSVPDAKSKLDDQFNNKVLPFVHRVWERGRSNRLAATR